MGNCSEQKGKGSLGWSRRLPLRWAFREKALPLERK
jgi:hypothetical protein